VLLIYIESTAADSHFWQNIIGCPDACAVFCGVREAITFIENPLDCVSIIFQLAIQISVARKQLPFTRQLAGGSNLESLDLLRTSHICSTVSQCNSCIGFLDLENRCSQC